MGRTHVTTIMQKTDASCGPASIKHALHIFGVRKSESMLSHLCKTTTYGTSTRHMIAALTSLNFAVLEVENASLNHLISALRHSSTSPRAVIVDYLYAKKGEEEDWEESGHWATVSSFSASSGKIILFDSYTGKKKSYVWKEFLKQWKDFELKRRRISKASAKFTMVKKWQKRLMLVVTRAPEDLPEFRLSRARFYV